MTNIESASLFLSLADLPLRESRVAPGILVPLLRIPTRASCCDEARYRASGALPAIGRLEHGICCDTQNDVPEAQKTRTR
jgi:hypothetical protein